MQDLEGPITPIQEHLFEQVEVDPVGMDWEKPGSSWKTGVSIHLTDTTPPHSSGGHDKDE